MIELCRDGPRGAHDAIGRDHLELKAVALATHISNDWLVRRAGEQEKGFSVAAFHRDSLDGISKISSSGALEGEGGQENTCHFAKL